MFARRPWLIPLGLAVVAQLLFGFRLAMPPSFVFDEVHYVPAARELLALSGPINVEHPLFGKTLIALSIALFGDNPLGWRALSTVAGTATVMALYAIARLLTGRQRPAVIAAMLAITCGTVFVQARIAMLDTFMAALLAGGLALLLWALRSPVRPWPKWVGGATLLGLAIGTKWAA
ncbi:MAG: phospholipid carrier-dependent glycosyltransferase, partial [Pseudomonadota bacterium]